MRNGRWRRVVAAVAAIGTACALNAAPPAGSAPRTAPSVCATPTRTITGGGSAQIAVAAGEIVLLTDGTFTGGINDFAAGSVLCVSTTATFNPQWLNNPRGSLVVLGASTLQSVNSTDTFSLRVEGTVSASGINLNGPAVVTVGPSGTLTTGSLSTSTGSVLDNRGTTTLGSANLNGDARLENSGTLTINSAVAANGRILNTGAMTISGPLTFNSGAGLDNRCELTVTGDLSSNTSAATNGGVIRVSGSLRVNGAFAQSAAGIVTAAGLVNDGSVTGFGRYSFSGATSTQRTFAGTNAADPIVVSDATPAPPQIFDVQSGTVVNVVAGAVLVPVAAARPLGCTGVGGVSDVVAAVTSPAEVTAGASFAFQITVTTAGPATAAAVVATLELAPAVTISDSGGGTVSGTTITWALGDLVSPSTVTRSVTVVAPGSGTVTGTTRANSPTPDPVPANNVASSVTTVATPIPPNQPPVVDDSLVFGHAFAQILGAVRAVDPDAGQTVAVSVTSGPTSGTVTMNASGSFTYVPNGAFTGSDTFAVTGCDNGTPSECDAAVVTVLVFPLAAPDSAETLRETAVTIPVLDNDLGNTSSPAIATPPANGSAVVVGNEVVYMPEDDFVGVDTFEYRICSPDGALCSVADVTVRVEEPPNQPPSIEPAAVTTVAGVPVSGRLVVSDPDPGQILTVTLLSEPGDGATVVVLTDGRFTYTPAPGFAGTDSFTAQVCDNGSPPLCASAAVAVTVGPLARRDAATTSPGAPVAIAVLANDMGVVAPPTVLTPPADGTAEVQTDGTILYTPGPTFTGNDVFTYQACTAGTPPLCASATVTITVGPNHPPDMPDVAATTSVGVAVVIPLDPFDPDPGQTLTLEIGDPPTNGTATVSFDGVAATVTYTPNDGFAGVDTFTFALCDPIECADPEPVATVSVLPVAVPDAAVTQVDETVPIDVRANDLGALGTPVIETAPSRGTATVLSDGTIAYTPASGTSGLDSFRYTVCAATAADLCASTLVTVAVFPTVSDVRVRTATGVPVEVRLLSQAQADAETVLEITTQPANGTVSVDTETGTVLYTPAAPFTGVEVVGFRACSPGPLLLCSSGVLTIEVAPVLEDDEATTEESTDVTIDVALNDLGDAANAIVVVPPKSGEVLGSGPALLRTLLGRGRADPVTAYTALTYRPSAGFVGTDSFVYVRCAPTAPRVCATAVVTIVVTQQPEPPVPPLPPPPPVPPPAPQPSPDDTGGDVLARTGLDLLALLLVGGNLVAAGAVTRRRRTRR